MPELIVNIDHVAALRQIGRANVPDPVAAAVRIENTAARGIAVHLWEDRRHIQDRDIRILRQVVQSEFILEMGSTAEMVGIALDLKPDRIVLVPEKQEETTTDGGLDLIVHKNAVAETIATLQNSGLPVGVFIDPDPEQISLAHQIIQDHDGHISVESVLGKGTTFTITLPVVHASPGTPSIRQCPPVSRPIMMLS